MDFAAITGIIHNVPTDFIVIGIAALLLVLLALYGGVSNMIAASVSALIVLALEPLVSMTAFISSFAGKLQGPSAEPVLFLILFVPIFVMMRWMARDTFEDTGPVQAILAGFATLAITLVIWQYMQSLSSIWNFGPIIDRFFAPQFKLLWLLGALVALSFSRR